MKVAILTQPLGHNYGGLLQAYALQKFLTKRGHHVETIDRRMPVSRRFKAKRDLLNVARLLTGRIKSLPTGKRQAWVLEDLTRFKKNQLSLSREIKNSDQMRAYFESTAFDAVVVGSDQVWRPKYSPSIVDFYLGFLGEQKTNVKKIAYAASFGVERWEYTDEQTQRCAGLAEEFDCVSVREKSGIKLCRDHLGIEASWVVDPTLLLEPSDYTDLVNQGDLSTDSAYLLSYVLDPAEEKRNIAYNIAKRLQIDCMTIKPEKSIEHVSPGEIGLCRLPSVESWLQSFNDASFIVTDSFHGTVFSILFNKPFIAVGNAARGLARFKSLLTEFGLENRLVESTDEITPELLNSPIDWTSVNKVREALAAEGQLFLDRQLPL